MQNIKEIIIEAVLKKVVSINNIENIIRLEIMIDSMLRGENQEVYGEKPKGRKSLIKIASIGHVNNPYVPDLQVMLNNDFDKMFHGNFERQDDFKDLEWGKKKKRFGK